MVRAVFERVAVIGGGSWGTTIASLLSARVPTLLWARRPELVDEINRDRTNRRYLGGVTLDPSLRASPEIDEVVAGADLILVAVPSHGLRACVERLAPMSTAGAPIVSLSKGLEPGTAKRMTEVIAEVAPRHPVGALTGPNLALEILHGQPAASVLAMRDEVSAVSIAALIATDTLRVYRNGDVIGCELAGAVKNVIAMAAGMGDGMGFGDNAKAAIMTRGLAEMTRLGVALGGELMTFMGLAGVGDLVATCGSGQSRNHAVGIELGRGRSLSAIVDETTTVAEGVRSAPVIVELATRHGVEMPIAQQVVDVCRGDVTPAEALAVLMARQQRSE